MTNILPSPQLGAFLPLEMVTISDGALEVAKQFGEEVAKAKPETAWVVVFDWWDNWSRNGVKQRPCLGLGVYEKSDVPAQVTRVKEGMTYAIMIPRAILDATSERRIDVESDGTTLALR